MIKQRIKTYYYFYYFILLTFIALMATVVSSLGAVSEGRNANLWSRAVSFFLWFYLWGLWSPLIFWLTRKFNFESCRRLVRHLVIHGFFGILISITHFAAFLTLSWLLDPTYQERNSSPLPLIKSSLLGGVYLVGLIFYLLVVFAAQAYISRQNYAAGKKKAALLQSALVEAQLQA